MKHITRNGIAAGLAAVMGTALLFGCGGVSAKENPKTDKFEIVMPEELQGIYEAEVTDNGISIYDKAAKESEYGGFAFSISTYENADEYAGGNMASKIGELDTEEGITYDVVMQEPSDVQYDPADDAQAEEYQKIYDFRKDAAQNIVGINGASYNYKAGTRGAENYGPVIEELISQIQAQFDASQFEEAGKSSMYAVVGGGGDAALQNIGYAFYDVNNDGIEELMIGEIAEGDWKGVIYDMYTIVDREPAHVVSGYDRDRYYVAMASVVEEYSSGASESGWNIYSLEGNSAELMPQISFKYDGYTDAEHPYFISYGSEDGWEQVSEDDFELQRGNFSEYQRFEYTPLSLYAPYDPAAELPVEVTELMEEADITQDEALGLLGMAALIGTGAMASILLVIYILEVIGLWKVFAKMGEPGWKSLIPVYNGYTLFKNVWTTGAFWVMLVLVVLGSVMGTGAAPGNVSVMNLIGFAAVVVGGIISLIQSWKLVKSFGKGVVFFILYVLFEPIMVIILGFGKDEFLGEDA